MSKTQNNEKQNTEFEGISIDDAARTALVQSVAFSAQNEVDALRNQSTIEMVALGSAYAKWLENPTMASEFEPLVNKVSMVDRSLFHQYPLNRNYANSAEPERLARQIFRQYLSSKK
ncbi:hypothetical protein D210916BOD24_11080 [Alteromonas sp. D210916BOD_24]|uniref:hypothetical protein n=1 Tax=Alteromonas sp. D210916BOD_24 TaxID=3157618 RepID=UPI00399C862F